jgi:hypothetical protein
MPSPNQNQIVFFDTTLRDGEQSPGCTMHHEEKLRLAHQIAALRVDVLEAGFAIASDGDFAAIRAVAVRSAVPALPHSPAANAKTSRLPPAPWRAPPPTASTDVTKIDLTVHSEESQPAATH